jgi:hypothetical protein
LDQKAGITTLTAVVGYVMKRAKLVEIHRHYRIHIRLVLGAANGHFARPLENVRNVPVGGISLKRLGGSKAFVKYCYCKKLAAWLSLRLGFVGVAKMTKTQMMIDEN